VGVSEQRGLAYARLAGDDRYSAFTTLCGLENVVDDATLGFAAE
jgi:hypothetical protein